MSANKQSPQDTSSKKAQVLGDDNQKKGVNKGVMIAVMAVLILGAAALGYMWMSSPSGGVATTSTAGAASDGTVVKIEAAMFKDGKAHFFKYDAPGDITVRYFVIKSSDGVIRAAFDACDVCWRAGKGYKQDGDVMVCVNCNRRFPSVKVNEVKGGCNPAPLKRSVQNGKVVIQVADILEGRRYFDFASLRG